MFLCYFSHLSFFKLYKTQQTPSTTKKSATNVGKKTKRQIKSVDIGPREATFSRPDKQTEICNWDLERIHLTGMTKKSIQKCIEFKTALKKVNVNWKLLLIDYNNINHTMWSKRQWTFCIQFAHFFFLLEQLNWNRILPHLSMLVTNFFHSMTACWLQSILLLLLLLYLFHFCWFSRVLFDSNSCCLLMNFVLFANDGRLHVKKERQNRGIN